MAWAPKPPTAAEIAARKAMFRNDLRRALAEEVLPIVVEANLGSASAEQMAKDAIEIVDAALDLLEAGDG